MSFNTEIVTQEEIVSFWLGWEDAKCQAKKFRTGPSTASRGEVILFVRRGRDD